MYPVFPVVGAVCLVSKTQPLAGSDSALECCLMAAITSLVVGLFTRIARRRKAPPHHNEFALAVRRSSDNRGHHVRVDGGRDWQITRQIALDTKEPAHRFLGPGDAVQVAH